MAWGPSTRGGAGVCLVGIKITPMSSSRGTGDVGVGVCFVLIVLVMTEARTWN